MSEKREGPTQGTQSQRTQGAKGHRKAMTHRGDDGHSPSPRFSHHLPRSPRTPPRAQRRTEAERRPTTRSQSQTASEECSSPLCRGNEDTEDDEVAARRPRPNFAVHAHACTAARAVWDPHVPSAQRTRQAATARGFEQCHQWARQPSRPAAAKAVWPPCSSDRTAVHSAASVRAPLIVKS